MEILPRGEQRLMIFNALSCDDRLMNNLTAGFSAMVHSVFNRVVNVRGSDKRLYTLAHQALDDAPDTLRIAMPPDTGFDNWAISVGASVFYRDGTLNLDRVRITLDGVRTWKAVLPDFPADLRDVLHERLIYFRQIILTEGKSGGMKAFLAGEAPTGIFPMELAARATRLLNCLAAKKTRDALSEARTLLGFGPGLTPSGDDFLTGLISVINMPDAPFPPCFRPWSRQVAVEAKNRTGDISFAMLENAAHGRVRENVSRLIGKIVDGTHADVEQAARTLFTIGSSSGTDIAVGIYAGMGLVIEQREVRSKK